MATEATYLPVDGKTVHRCVFTDDDTGGTFYIEFTDGTYIQVWERMQAGSLGHCLCNKHEE